MLFEFGTVDPQVVIELELDDGSRCAVPVAGAARDAARNKASIAVRLDPVAFPRAIRIAPRGEALRIERIATFCAGAEEFRKACSVLGAEGAGPVVFTAHGGGEEVNRWGQLWSDYGLAVYPQNVALAADRPDSPFYALAALRDAGIRFFNPMDLLFDHEIKPIDQLIETRTAQDGTPYYTFRRYLPGEPLPEQTPPMWTFAKHGATAQALPAVSSELMHRFHRAAPGHGAIIYTHLGNRVGNELAPRLGWTEELHAALNVIAERYFARDRECSPPFRLWLTTPASALAYAALMRGMRTHVEVRGATVLIRSWHDAALGHAIPDVKRFGGAWLHGLTVYVDDPLAARVVVDGEDYP
ncbi:MAG: hypothetical protein ACRDF6_13310, partial [bacterium]